MSYKIGVENVGLSVEATSDDGVARQHLVEAARGSNLELVDRHIVKGKKDGGKFSVSFAWVMPAGRLGRYISVPSDEEVIRDLLESKLCPLVFSEMTGALNAIAPHHFQRLILATNYENRARSAGLDISKLSMIPLGSIAKVGAKRLEHLVFFSKDMKSHDKPQLRQRTESVHPLWLFPVRSIGDTAVSQRSPRA